MKDATKSILRNGSWVPRLITLIYSGHIKEPPQYTIYSWPGQKVREVVPWTVAGAELHNAANARALQKLNASPESLKDEEAETNCLIQEKAQADLMEPIKTEVALYHSMVNPEADYRHLYDEDCKSVSNQLDTYVHVVEIMKLCYNSQEMNARAFRACSKRDANPLPNLILSTYKKVMSKEVPKDLELVMKKFWKTK